jgi:hypothetical protein
MNLPMQGWMPESDDNTRPYGPAHYVPPGCDVVPDKHGIAYLALCGARCFPVYGNDASGRMARHRRCPSCERDLPESAKQTSQPRNGSNRPGTPTSSPSQPKMARPRTRPPTGVQGGSWGSNEMLRWTAASYSTYARELLGPPAFIIAS